MLSEAYGGEPIKKPGVPEWLKRFKEGHENVEGDEKSCRPRSYRTDENVENVRNLVHSDRRLSIRAVIVQLNLDKETNKFEASIWT
jgi:transposase